MDAVEFVDYIFDRYAYLGLAPDAGKEEVHQVIKRLRAGLHTDKIRNLDPELLEKAGRKRALVDDCAKILENDQMRAVYDEKLAWFKAEKPRLVSESGMPVIDIYSPRFQYEDLLQGNEDNFDALQARAAELAGYDARQDATAARRYKARPRDAGLREDYRYQVGKRLTYLTALEHAAWLSAGYNTADTTRGSALYADDYLLLTNQLITDTKERIAPAAIGQRQDLVALGMAQPLLLLTHTPQEGAAPVAEASPGAVSEAATAEIIKTVQDKFESKAGRIRTVARQKQETLEELLTLSPTYVFNRPAQMGDGPRLVYIFAEPAEDKAEPTLRASFNFLKNGNNLSLNGLEVQGAEDIPLSAIRKQARKGPPAIGILHSQPLGDMMEHSGMLMEATHAIGVLEDTPAPTPRKRARPAGAAPA